MYDVLEIKSEEEVFIPDMIKISKNRYFLSEYSLEEVRNVFDSAGYESIDLKTTSEDAVFFLLDLNKTLAKECRWDWKTATYYPAEDVYSKELADQLQQEKSQHNCYVHLVTARGEIYQGETLKFINQQIPKFVVDSCVFKKPKHKYVRVHSFKAEYVKILLSLGVSPDNMFGIESNADTRREYKKLGVQSQTRQDFLDDRVSRLI